MGQLLSANPRYKANPDSIKVGDELVIPVTASGVTARKKVAKKKTVKKKLRGFTRPAYEPLRISSQSLRDN